MPQKFKDHIKTVYSSERFKAAERESSRFFMDVSEFLFGRPANLIQAVRGYSPPREKGIYL